MVDSWTTSNWFSFWNANDPPASSTNTTTAGVKIPNQKDLSKFQTSQDLPHTVNIHVGQSHYRVNSLILALHSSVFERILFSGLDEIDIETSLQGLENIEKAVYTSILILYGKDEQISQEILELCFGFAAVYDITILRNVCLERFSSFILTGNSFLNSFMRIASKYPAPWRDTLLLSLLSTAHKDSPVLSDLKNDTAKLLDLCRTVENSPLILGKLLWFLRDNDLVPALKFTELKFLPKFLILEDDSFSVVREFCIQITKDCVTMVTPPSTPPTPPTRITPYRPPAPHQAPYPPPITRRPAPELPSLDTPSFTQSSGSISPSPTNINLNTPYQPPHQAPFPPPRPLPELNLAGNHSPVSVLSSTDTKPSLESNQLPVEINQELKQVIDTEINSIDSRESAETFLRCSKWKLLQNFDQLMALKIRCIAASNAEDPFPIFLFIDNMFLWLQETKTEVTSTMYIQTFNQLPQLLPNGVTMDLKSALTSMRNFNTNSDVKSRLNPVRYQSENYTVMRIRDGCAPLKIKSRKGITIDLPSQECPIEGCLSTHRFFIEIRVSSAHSAEISSCSPGHEVVFYYGIKEQGTELQWLSLNGKGRNQIREFLGDCSNCDLILVLRNSISSNFLKEIKDSEAASSGDSTFSNSSLPGPLSFTPVLTHVSSQESLTQQSEVSSVKDLDCQISEIDSAESAIGFIKHWKRLKTFDQVLLLRDKCVSVSTGEDPGPLFWFIDHMFLWLYHTETQVTDQMRVRILCRLPQLLLPAVFSKDLRWVLNFLAGIDSEPKVKNQNNKFVVAEFKLDKETVLRSLNQKCIQVNNEEFDCPIEGCKSPHPLEVTLGITAPYNVTTKTSSPGHQIIFSYIITESATGTTKKWISLQGLGRKQIREKIGDVKVSNIIFVLRNCIPHAQVSTFSTQLTTRESILELIISESWLKLNMKQFYELISVSGKVCPGSKEAYLCVDAMMAWGQFKRINNLTGDHFGRLSTAWQNCRLNWSYMNDVRTGFSLFDGIYREDVSLEKSDFSTFVIELKLPGHSTDELKKQNCLPFQTVEIQCEVRGCSKTHKFSFALRFSEEESTLLFNSSPVKDSTIHFDLILHFYMVVQRPGKPDFFFPIAVMNKNEIFSFIEGERKDNPKAKFVINVVLKRC